MEPFRFKKFDVKQTEGVFKIGTDACLLGSLINLSEVKSILEIGSGTGVISLMLAQRSKNAIITAIDISAPAIELTANNFHSSPWASRLSAFRSSILDFEHSTHGSFDLIITNPPFFKDSIKSQEDSMAIARHESDLNLENLIGISKSLMSRTGKTALVLPYQRRKEFEFLLTINGLTEVRLILIRPKKDRDPNRFISEFSSNTQAFIEESLILYDHDNELTIEANRLLQKFYLKL
jgi:tRNA1Val (adenine37-N6)-methyltransferase